MKKTLLLLLIILSCFQTKAQCWKTVTAGYSYTAATQTDNSLWSWGENKSGQLGDGTLINNYTPKKIGTASDWKIVVTGTNHTVALKNDGSLWAWGNNNEGQLGDGTSTNKSIPTQIGTATNWQTVAAGNQYTMALKNDGTLWAWGDNYFGELGTGNSSDSSIPKQVGTATDWKSITVGYFHTIALKTDGTLWTWGGNDDGQLGDGTTSKSYSPKKIGTATDWKIICGGGSHTLAIKTDGSLWAWGKNKYGELGNGTTTDSYVPIKIGTSTDWKSLGAAGDHTIAIKTDGSLWNWGYNSHNELGNGTTLNSLVPIQIGASKNWQDVAAGWYYTAAVSSDGVMWTFGNNSDGQLGDDTNVNKNVPITVVCLSSFTMATSQANITCFGDKNGSASVTSVSGGTAPYSYLWSNGKTTATITGLTPGTYSCIVTDASSLSITNSIVITEPSPLAAIITSSNACNNNSGSITATATGGTAPYQYGISNLVFQSSNVFTNLSAGVYELYVKDNNGCIISNIVTVTAANTPPPTATAQTFNTGATVTNLQSAGSNVKWYNNITGGNPLSLLTALQTGKYYVSQTINGCESSRTVADVTVTSLIPTYVPSNGLIAYYPFTGNANDVSGNGYNGTATGAVLITDKEGNPNSAYSFDGVNSYIDAAIAAIPQNNAPRTISGWFKTNSPNFTENNYSTIFNYGNLSTTQRFALSIYSKGYLDFITASDFSNSDLGVQNNYLNNTWYFFTITYDGTKVSLFVDGNYVDGKNITLNTINKTFKIGKRITGDTRNEYFKGSIDDIGIWNRVLTANEITGLYNSKNNLYTLIPDVNFEKKLIALGVDSGATDGKVLTNSINKLTSLDVSASSITDLTGIQDFSALTNLNCDSNKLTTLDVSKNLNLNKIDCNYNQIITLDVSNNLNLKSLGSAINKLTTLDVTKNITLTELNCENNQLTALDISKNASLGRLRCPNNQLKTLDVSFNVALDTLVCYTNKLSRLDISKNIVLKQLNCSSNQLISLNLKNGSNINFVNSKLSFGNNPNLSCIQVDDVAYANANWANKKDAAANFNTDCATANLYTYIPDINFEKKLIGLGIDSGAADGKVLTVNVSSITSLDVSNSNISSLSGIEDFVSLTKLDCGTNKLLTLNVSNNKFLKDLNCRYNNLSVLDLSSNLKLTALDCIYNQITSLDVTKMSNLESLLCTANQLTSLDVTNNLALYWFGCNSNKLTTLNVSQNKLLQYLDCGFNQLTVLDVSNNTALFYLNCYYNKLTALDVSMLTELTDLSCSDSKLSELNVSKNTKLKSLLCEKMTFSTLDISNNPALKELYCGNGNLTTLDVSKNKALTILQCSNNQLSDLNIKNGTNTLLTDVNFIQNPDLTCIQVDDVTYSNKNWSTVKDVTANYSANCKSYTLIPDANFENKLISLGIDKGAADGKVLTSNINKLTFLNVSGANISSLEGIDGFSALTNLMCNGNQLTSLDLSNNDQLQILDSSNNRLTELYTSKSNNLVALTCENNLLSTLDITNNTALDLLDFSGNQLSSIDLSQHKALSQLFCGSNKLTKLDLSKNTLLKDLNCSSNQLISLNLKNGSNTNLHSFNIHLDKNPNLSCIQVDSKTYSDTNWLNFKDVTANYNEDCDSYTLIPDANFEQKLIDLGIDTDGSNGKVLTSRISALTSLDVSESGIKSLTGIENFVNLNTIKCSLNQLTILDISKNTALSTLYCNSNQLKTLDVSKNTALFTLHCESNQLTALDLSKNTALTDLICSSNQLTSLDVSNQKALWYLGCSSNKLTALDISKNTALWSLSCDSNQLTTLDIKANTGLEALYCFSNQLTSLDITNQTKLKYLDCSSNQLTTLDVSKNLALWNFSCNSNQLTYLNLKNGNNTKFNTISFINNPKLTCILVDDAVYSNANWVDKKDVTASYNVDCTPYIPIPNSNFEQKLIDLGIDTDGLNGKISVSNTTNIKNLDLSNSNISNLSGIEQFTSLETLICKGNSLSTITISNNTALKYLDCSNNPLTTLDVSKNTQLTELHCDGIVSITTKSEKIKNSNAAQLTVLDLSNNLFLTKLSCSNNQLVNLDLSKNTLLTDLNCSNNQLTDLILNNGNNTNMVNVSFKNNSSLSCIKVDNPVYSNTNWNTAKDITATYSSTCSKLGIEDSVFDKIVISPNPTKGELYINNVVLEKTTVYDSLGKLVKTTTFTSGANDNTIHLEGLPSGVYYIYLESEGANTAKKIIVE